MKKVIYLFTTVLLFSCGQATTTTEQANNTAPDKDHIAVYDFHTDHRCETCLAIEKATIETLDENFKSKVDEKDITFTLLNADASENATIAEEYEAYGTTLAITVVKDGNKEILDITNWAFTAIHGDDFKSELTEKINTALAKL